LCGDDAFKTVVLVTTKWSEIEEVVGEQREKRLKEEFWKTMINHGTQIRRYKCSSESAWDIVNLIRKKEEKEYIPIQIQKEMVDLQKYFLQTKVGEPLFNSLKALLASQKEARRLLRLRCEEDQSPDLQEELEKVEKQIRSTFERIQHMKIPLGQRIPLGRRILAVLDLRLSLTLTATPVLKSAGATDRDSHNPRINPPLFATDNLEIYGSIISNAGRDQRNNFTIINIVNYNLISGA
jgi:hypothetical protein